MISMSAFCVAKYEMKSRLGQAVSQDEGMPWVMINRDHSIMVCKDMGENYDLISNDEWQVLARNIESVPKNWDQSLVGSVGGLNRGHSDNKPARALPGGDDNNGCMGTGQTCSNVVWNNQRRTHVLSNGEVIWDMAGNVWEWVKDDNMGVAHGPDSYFSKISSSSHTMLYYLENEFSMTSRVAKGQFGPRGDYTYLGMDAWGGLGYGVLSSNGGGVGRGGYWYDGAKSGIFSVDLSQEKTDSHMSFGFRCVYRP